MRRQRLQHRELVRHLGAAEQAQQRAFGFPHRVQLVEFRPQEVARGPPLHERRNARGRGVRPMGGAERIVHVRVGQRGELGRECRVVLRLAGIEAHVLEDQQFAGGQRRDRALGLVARRLRAEPDRTIPGVRRGAPRLARGRATARARPSDGPGAKRGQRARPRRAVGAAWGERRGCACRPRPRRRTAGRSSLRGPARAARERRARQAARRGSGRTPRWTSRPSSRRGRRRASRSPSRCRTRRRSWRSCRPSPWSRAHRRSTSACCR